MILFQSQSFVSDQESPSKFVHCFFTRIFLRVRYFVKSRFGKNASDKPQMLDVDNSFFFKSIVFLFSKSDKSTTDKKNLELRIQIKSENKIKEN